MERLTIEDMKSIELEIMDEIDRVCVAHGVQYYLGYGSLLGAVRQLRSFAVTDPSTGTNGFVKLVKRVVCPFVQNLDLFELAHRLDVIALRVNDSSHDSDCVIDVLGEGRSDKTYPVSLFSPIRMKFEDREYYAPAGYEEFLTTEYGDWRTPPAENARPVHVMEAYRL